MLLHLSAIPAMYSQSQHHLRVHCSYKSHIPQTKSLFSWLWVSKIALHRQQGWGLFDARSTRGETHKVTREMLWQSEQHSYPATSSAWPLQITTLPTPGCLTELLTYRMPLQFKYRRNFFFSSAGKMQKSLSWENQCSSPSHCSGIKTSDQKVTHITTTTRNSHSLGSLSFLRKCLPKHLTYCRKVTCIVHYWHMDTSPFVTFKSPSSEEGCPGNFYITTAFWASLVLTHLKLSHSGALDEGILFRFPKTGIRPI